MRDDHKERYMREARSALFSMAQTLKDSQKKWIDEASNLDGNLDSFLGGAYSDGWNAALDEAAKIVKEKWGEGGACEIVKVVEAIRSLKR